MTILKVLRGMDGGGGSRGEALKELCVQEKGWSMLMKGGTPLCLILSTECKVDMLEVLEGRLNGIIGYLKILKGLE